MYYLIRVILVIVLFSLMIFALIMDKKLIVFSKRRNPEIYKKFKTDMQFRRAVYITNISLSIVLLVLILISCFPFEGYFISFDSVNDSLAYKLISVENVDTYDYGDCVFAVDNSGNKIYSITKTNGRYKLVDFNSENIKYVQVPERGRDETTEPRIAKYNKDTNKTFYYIGVGGKTKPQDGMVTLDGNKMEYCSSEEQVSLVGSATWYTWIYSLMDESEPKSQVAIFSGTKEVQIYKLNQVFYAKYLKNNVNLILFIIQYE